MTINKFSKMALAYAMLAEAAQNQHFSPNPIDNKSTPDWARKKCKSCSSYTPNYGARGGCGRPNQQACSHYKKRK